MFRRSKPLDEGENLLKSTAGPKSVEQRAEPDSINGTEPDT